MADTPASRRVLVTGGGRGLGSAIVRTLAAAGHDVTFTYRSASAEADALVKELDRRAIRREHSPRIRPISPTRPR